MRTSNHYVKFSGHKRFFVVADRTVLDVNSEAVAQARYPGVPLRSPLPGNQGFFDCQNAREVLGWSGKDE